MFVLNFLKNILSLSIIPTKVIDAIIWLDKKIKFWIVVLIVIVEFFIQIFLSWYENLIGFFILPIYIISIFAIGRFIKKSEWNIFEKVLNNILLISIISTIIVIVYVILIPVFQLWNKFWVTFILEKMIVPSLKFLPETAAYSVFSAPLYIAIFPILIFAIFYFIILIKRLAYLNNVSKKSMLLIIIWFVVFGIFFSMLFTTFSLLIGN